MKSQEKRSARVLPAAALLAALGLCFHLAGPGIAGTGSGFRDAPGAFSSLLLQAGTDGEEVLPAPPPPPPTRIRIRYNLADTTYGTGAPVTIKYTAPEAGSLAIFLFNLAEAFEENKNDTEYKKIAESYGYELSEEASATIKALKGKSVDTPTLCGVSPEYNKINSALDLFVLTSLYSDDLAELQENSAPLFYALGDQKLGAKLMATFQAWDGMHAQYYPTAAPGSAQLLTWFGNRTIQLRAAAAGSKVNNFLGNKWPYDLPFTVAITPIPKNSTCGVGGRTYASAIHLPVHYTRMAGNDGGREMDRKVGTVVHEIFHSILGVYMNPPDGGTNVVKEFFNGEDPAKLTNDFSEVMATAVGQGHVGFDGDTGVEWHSFTGVDGAAKEMYDLFMTYLYYNKPLDKAFMSTFLSVRNKYRSGGYTWGDEKKSGS